jgi:CO dehydrogenase nickel-insertion accessory protein CooC1
MRVVFLGKGGSGKSTIAGLLCAELAGRGQRVTAIDADTVPGLDLVHGGWKLDASPAEIVDRCSREAPGGVRFLQMGNVDSRLKEHEMRREQHLDRWSGTVAFNTVSRVFDEAGGWTIVDLQGGTLQVANGMVGTNGIAVLVVEPFAKSVLTARRFVEMGRWPKGVRLVGVASKVSSPEDEAYVESALAKLGVPLLVAVPKDPAVVRAERERRPIVSVESGAGAKQAVSRLADLLTEAALATSTN